jgi:hypothetical protein
MPKQLRTMPYRFKFKYGMAGRALSLNPFVRTTLIILSAWENWLD